MLTFNFSEEETQQLKYEKYFNACPRIRKRSHVVYLKMSQKMSNEAIAVIVCCHHNSVRNWLNFYQSGGISSLLETNYYYPESELESYAGIIHENLNRKFTKSTIRQVL